ncbi:MAG: VOC family protein [Chloroflexota bacterium]
MSKELFRVEHLDHVELFVPDQKEAAAWYQQLFGLQILPDYAFWAADGPLMISSDDGKTMLALFKGNPPSFKPLVGFQRVAFRVSGAGMFAFLGQVKTFGVYTHEGEQTRQLPIMDHDLAYSVYFCDPYGNRYEVTTYDYQYVAEQLALQRLAG